MVLYNKVVGFLKVNQKELDEINAINDTSYGDGDFIWEDMELRDTEEIQESKEDLAKCEIIHLTLVD